MTFAKIKTLTKEEACQKLTIAIMCGAFPAGCACFKPSAALCGWCRNFSRVRRNTMKILNRIKWQDDRRGWEKPTGKRGHEMEGT